MSKKLFKAIFCVTFFSVATRALGFLLKIYLSRVLGSVQLGSYQIAMSIFGVLMTFVSSGIPVVLSRNVSYYSGQNNKKGIGSIVSSGLILTGLICLTVCIVIFSFPNLLSKVFTSTASLQMLYILTPALVFSSIYEVLRGALWGEQKFFTISFTEFIEQVVRIIIILILFNTSFVNISDTNKTALSLTSACVVSAIIVIIIYTKNGGKLENPKYEFKNLLKTSTPITAVKTVSSIVSCFIAIIIPLRLMTYGYSETEALSEFGIIIGMSFPILMIPATLISSLAVTMIPGISEQSNDIESGNIKDMAVLKSKIMFSIKTSIIFSSIFLPIFLTLGTPICEILFKNSKAGTYLSIATITMIPLGISQITSSILNAIGLEMKSLKNYVVSSGLLIICIYFLPKYIGTYALIVGYMLMPTTLTIMNLIMLSKRKLINYDYLKTIALMLIISAFASAVGYFTYNILNLPMLFNLIIAGGITFGSSLLLTICFNVGNFKFILMRARRR